MDKKIIEAMAQAIFEEVGTGRVWSFLSESTRYDDRDSKPYWRNAAYAAYRAAIGDDSDD